MERADFRSRTNRQHNLRAASLAQQSVHAEEADQQSIMEYNGGSVVAMVGKDCVAIAGDLRLGQQATGVAMNFEKVFPINDTLYFGLPGLATDVFTL